MPHRIFRELSSFVSDLERASGAYLVRAVAHWVSFKNGRACSAALVLTDVAYIDSKVRSVFLFYLGSLFPCETYYLSLHRVPQAVSGRSFSKTFERLQ